MTSILLRSNIYDVYVDLNYADEYLEAASHATTWQDETDNDVKARAIITASRLLDRQVWKGTKTSDIQALAWPRTGTGIDGVEDDVIPTALEQACCELSLALLDGSDVQSAQNQSQKIQSLKAGSVALTYFRGAEGTPTRFPQIVQELLRDYLSGPSSSLYNSSSTGISDETVVSDLGYSQPL